MNKEIKSPLVVGYKGEIGSFILQGLLKVIPKALNIWCYDVYEARSEVLNRIRKADVIFLCIPMEETITWFEKNKGLLRGKVLIEQCSLKTKICSHIKKQEKEWGFTLLSMHILFRPSATPNIEDRRVALIDAKSWPNSYRACILATTNSSPILFLTCLEHDIVMAYQQALVHRVILVLDRLSSDLPGKTYISGKICELAKRIRSGDPTLYSLIQENESLPFALSRFTDEFRNFDIKKEMEKK